MCDKLSIKELREQVRKLQRPAGKMRRDELIKYIEMNGADMPRPPVALVDKAEIKRITRARNEDVDIPQVEIYTEERGIAGVKAGAAKPVTAREAMVAQEIRQKLSSRKGIESAQLEIVEQKLRSARQREQEAANNVPKRAAKEMETQTVTPRKTAMTQTSRATEEVETQTSRAVAEPLKEYQNKLKALKESGMSHKQAEMELRIMKEERKAAKKAEKADKKAERGGGSGPAGGFGKK